MRAANHSEKTTMRNFRRQYWILPLVFLVASCSRKMSLQDEFSYDPPGSFDTADKPIEPPIRSTSWLDASGMYLDTNFDGGRISGAELNGEGVLTLTIAPERAPVNNSAWYAFRLKSQEPRQLTIRMVYEDGTHRYIPKISRDGSRWEALPLSQMHEDSTAGTLDFQLDVGADTLWISAQELMNSGYFREWFSKLREHTFVTEVEFGRSRQDRPLTALKIAGDPDAQKYVLVLGRQHPPEVSGSIALQAYVEAIAAPTPLAERFRAAFTTVAVPVVNPDGVDGGHWRTNAGGADLNRDWQAFNQPETRQVRDYLTEVASDRRSQVFFAIDFHSTQEDIFYTLAKDIPTAPPGFTDDWLKDIDHNLPHYRVVEEAYGLDAPISKNWIYKTFGCPAVTYEVGDEVDRELIRKVSRQAARSMMRLLLEE